MYLKKLMVLSIRSLFIIYLVITIFNNNRAYWYF